MRYLGLKLLLSAFFIIRTDGVTITTALQTSSTKCLISKRQSLAVMLVGNLQAGITTFIFLMVKKAWQVLKNWPVSL